MERCFWMAEDSEDTSYPSFLEPEKMSEGEVKEVEERFSGLLKDITADTRQLSEYLVEEGGTVAAICASLKKVFSELDLSVALPKEAVPSMEKSKEIILNPEGHLIIVQKDGTVESKSLEKYPPETILMVVWGVIPKLREEVSNYMKRVRVRLNFLEMVNEELKNIERPFETTGDSVPGKSIGEFEERKVREVLLPR